MAVRLEQFLHGLFFGMGLFVAYNVLNFLAQFLHAGPLPGIGH